MNIKKIIILSIILTLLTTGVVSAVENTSEDMDDGIDDVGAISKEMGSSMENEIYSSKNSENIDVDVPDETFSIYEDDSNGELITSNDEMIRESEQNNKSEFNESENNKKHYGYWVNSIDMVDLNLTDMSKHGVTDLLLNYYAYTRYNQSTIESFISNATKEDIDVHIWAQLFYDGKWVRHVINGTVNQEYFDTKIKELELYANTPGVAGIHFDYLRFSGSAYYNNSAEQNPGGMEAITEFVNQATTRLHEINPNLTVSAALMPEIEYLIPWYGDDYEALSEKLDVIIPMVYVGNFRQNATWVEETTQWFVNNSKGAEVWTGLQGYTVNDVNEVHISNSPHSQMSIEIKSALNGGSNGAIIFRYGVCDNIDFVNLPIDEYEFSTFNNLDYVISCSRDYAILDQDFTFNPTHDTGYVNGIGIHRNNLIIDGNNHIINGSSLARMFNVTGKNITFQNIIFVNGNSDNNGGVLYITGDDVKIINCTFIDNHVAIDGGAVYIKAPNATIINSTFINNTAIYNAAVYMNSFNGQVINSYFENNNANISAGAIGWAKNENGLIDHCTFINNSAYNEGGGAVFWNQGLNGKIINSKFEKNYGNFNGSAIFWSYGDNGIISNCSFTNNNANVSGGAIILKGENITVEDCEFNNNTADTGGAIYIGIGDSDLINCTFTNNHANDAGGAVLIENNYSDNLIESDFINNSAKNGGAIYFNGSVNNTIINGTFRDNTAEHVGGAIYFKDKVENNIIKSEFNHNMAREASGGAIFFHNITVNNTFESIFKDNEAVYGAGMFFYNITDNNIFNSDFRDNTAISCGGAMFFHNITNNNVFKGYFINNTAFTGNGGAITFKDTSINSSFTCDFVNNTAKDYGGGVNYRVTPYDIVFNSDFINNKAEYGGGINFFVDMVNVTFNGKFINNSAEYGGGICVQNAIIENTSLINNQARYGGAIFTNGRLVVNNTSFITNNADKGGAIYANNTAPILYNSVLINNTKDTFNIKAITYNCTIIEQKDSQSNKTVPKTPKNHIQTHKITQNNRVAQTHTHTIKLADSNTLVYTGDKLTLDALNKIFDLNFTNGHLLVYIDGILVFNGTTSDDITLIIIELLDKYLGEHEIKVVFTDNENQTNTYKENIIVG